MSIVYGEISASVDGFVAGPDAGTEFPLGRGGDRLHDWVVRLEGWRKSHGHDGGVAGIESERLEAAFENTGAFIMGRKMYDTGEEPWGEQPPFRSDVFVLTHEQREPRVASDTTFHFVNGGPAAALELARESAGPRDVQISGGGVAISAFLAAGLIDELEIHTVPVLFGAGAPLFTGLAADQTELERIHNLAGESGMVHTRYRVVRPANGV